MNTRDYPEYIETAAKLTPFERTLLTLLAIACEPAPISMLLACLRKLDIRNSRGNLPTAANINHYLKKFTDAGFISEKRVCEIHLTEILCKEAINNGKFHHFAETIRDEAPLSYYSGKWSTRCWRALRELRIGIYSQDYDLIDEATAFLSGQSPEYLGIPPATVRILCYPFDKQWLRSLPGSFQFYLLSETLQYGQRVLKEYPALFEYLTNEEDLSAHSDDERIPFHRLLWGELLVRGDFSAAETLITTNPDSFKGTGALGTIFFLQGKKKKALQSFAEDSTFLKKLTGTDNIAFFGAAGLFYILALIEGKGENKAAESISCALTLFSKRREAGSYRALAAAVAAQGSAFSGDKITLPESNTGEQDTLEVIFCALSQYWTTSTIESEVEEQVIAKVERAKKEGFLLYAALLYELFAISRPADTATHKIAEELRNKLGCIRLTPLITPEEPWKRSLQALIAATDKRPTRDTLNNTKRMAWLLGFADDSIQISAREQKHQTDGSWSKGRIIIPAKLYHSTAYPYLTAQDRQICAAIIKEDRKEGETETGGNQINQANFSFDIEKVLPAMINHPFLFLADSPETPLELVEGEPELLIEELEENLHIRFAHPISLANINFYRETPTRVKILKITDKHRKIAQITGTDGILVPREASAEVLQAIGNISSFMTVHSAIADYSENNKQKDITFVEADSTIHIHLLPYGTGFRLEMFVKPFTDGGNYLKPGQGVENMMAEVDGKRLQTRRDLTLEEENAREVEELCPVLDLAIDFEQENEREWHLAEPDDCLQALIELQEIRDKIVIEWPEGEKIALQQHVNAENLNLKIRTNRQNWFSISGELSLDQGKVIELRELLSKIKKSSGRFVEIGDGQFIALTQEFRKRLDDLELLAEEGENEGDDLLVHPLAAMQLEQLTRQAQTAVDTGWQQQLQCITEMQNFMPQVPSTLQAELRHYQQEGFEWLARLANWGLGGCLADDMGLGKTLQSLAVILDLAAEGPSLVIAPTSVSGNWQSEAERFAPTLTLHTLSGKNRRETIESLGKFDLLITTYTLLQQESKLLSSIKWQAVILDEAQAIKNSATKRSQAAKALNAKFRLITTGTPIENHLGELWNLFHFINPGLLGSIAHFNEHFAIPIERYSNREAKMRLKALIRPFLLRRIKSQVLDELPPRTEITLKVEMTEDELHFYEALRQDVIEKLENNRQQKGHHLQILTEIMRLRQACCNVRLIEPNSSIESSKLKLFSDIVKELLASGHKALVFSQFIGHLDIIRKFLDSEKIHYQYLDGKTPAKQRKVSVDAFQAGVGDLFLISLKAGGLGLNLTAADYVIHLDPWWNPAIEDQASDRAYRIGQTRPVTIYRLVCKDTIEEKIVRLHQEKRELAKTLLEGTDSSAKMNPTELLELIKEA